MTKKKSQPAEREPGGHPKTPAKDPVHEHNKAVSRSEKRKALSKPIDASDQPPVKIVRCSRCHEILKPDQVVNLELSKNDGYYYDVLPKGHVSTGQFPFSKQCAASELEFTRLHTTVPGSKKG